VVRCFLGDGEAPFTGEDRGKKFSSLIDVARGSGELEKSSSISKCRQGERAYRVDVVMVSLMREMSWGSQENALSSPRKISTWLRRKANGTAYQKQVCKVVKQFQLRTAAISWCEVQNNWCCCSVCLYAKARLGCSGSLEISAASGSDWRISIEPRALMPAALKLSTHRNSLHGISPSRLHHLKKSRSHRWHN
jgi:hypothetical protein